MSVPVQLSSFDKDGGSEEDQVGKDAESFHDAAEFAAAFATTTTTVKPSSKASKTTVMSAKGSKQPTSMGKFGLKE
jgi:hypothetical protein